MESISKSFTILLKLNIVDLIGLLYLDDLTELPLNKKKSSDTEAPFLDLDFSITNGINFSNIYDNRDDFKFKSS